MAWFEDVHAWKLLITSKLVQEKATSYVQLQIKSLTGSSGWLEKFCRQNNIVLKDLFGENESINENILAVVATVVIVNKRLWSQVHLCYTVDQVGILYPNKK